MGVAISEWHDRRPSIDSYTYPNPHWKKRDSRKYGCKLKYGTNGTLGVRSVARISMDLRVTDHTLWPRDPRSRTYNLRQPLQIAKE